MDNPGSDDEELYGSDKEDENRKHSAFTCQGKSKCFNKAGHGTPRSIDCGESVDGCTKLAAIRTIKVGRDEAVTSS